MNKTFQLRVDIKLIVIVVLALALIVTIGIWQPWSSTGAPSRTLTITGEATVSSAPDEFVFYPTYQESGTNRQATLEKINTKVNSVISELKKLGVSEDSITLSENAYTAYWVNDKDNNISVTITVKIDNKDLAQKVQDYILTTTPTGQITAWPTFSDEKRKNLESDARLLAIKDAKTKAEKTVSEVGASLGKIVTISDNQMGIMPMIAVAEGSETTTKTSLPISTGKQDVSVSVQVVYELR